MELQKSGLVKISRTFLPNFNNKYGTKHCRKYKIILRPVPKLCFSKYSKKCSHIEKKSPLVEQRICHSYNKSQNSLKLLQKKNPTTANLFNYRELRAEVQWIIEQAKRKS